LRTRVGYAGGRKENPTYYNLGDHTETMEVDFDPSLISLRQLVDEFIKLEHVRRRVRSVQYRNAIFWRTAEQRDLFDEVLQASGRADCVDIEKFKVFYLAEDYHQKYYLQESPVMEEFQAMFKDIWALNDSTAAARANAFISGFGSARELQELGPKLGLGATAQKTIAKLHGSPGFYCF
jgi:peptide methionine sulfoxide reductase MsrA